MAEPEKVAAGAEGDLHSDEEGDAGYKVPERVSASAMLEKDKDDEALQNYKRQLLGDTSAVASGLPLKVSIVKMALVSLDDDHRKDIELTGDLDKLKAAPIAVKEGVRYKIEFNFKVENDIVTGLKYQHVVKRKGVKVDKENHMLGSYAANTAENPTHRFLTPENEMPSGMLARGHYSVSSKFMDDDQNVYAEWDWSFDLSKEWK
jgi:Rho GDP-dissociation inhibitor